MIALLPGAERFDPTKERAGRVDDLFLCALGFEDRCLTLPTGLAAARYRAGQVGCFVYSTNEQDNDVNRDALVSALQEISDDVVLLDGDSGDMRQELARLKWPTVSGDTARVTFDVSVVSNRLLVSCLTPLLNMDVDLEVLYSEAAHYHPTKAEYESDPSKWMDEDSLGTERGVGKVEISKEHPGNHTDLLPDCVLLFPSFRLERSQAIITFVDPALSNRPGEKVLWLLGVPHLLEDHWRIEAMMVINGLTEDHSTYEVSTFDYREAISTLDRIYEEYSLKYRLSLAPIGSKMQAVATSLFCHIHPDVRIVLATPEEYNAQFYSSGCKATWRIAFGATSELRTLLESVGTLSIED